MYCPNCGSEVVPAKTRKPIPTDTIPKKTFNSLSNLEKCEIKKLNKKIKLHNSQTSIVKGVWYSAGFFLLIIILAYMDLGVVNFHPAIVLI